jgi:hypothetical protein
LDDVGADQRICPIDLTGFRADTLIRTLQEQTSFNSVSWMMDERLGVACHANVLYLLLSSFNSF